MAGLDAALEWIDSKRRREEADPFDLARAVVERDTGLVAGTVSLSRCHRRDTGEFVGEYEVGWTLHPDSAGQGYATEAARALLDDVFAAVSPRCGAGSSSERRVCRVAERARPALLHRRPRYGEPVTGSPGQGWPSGVDCGLQLDRRDQCSSGNWVHRHDLVSTA